MYAQPIHHILLTTALAAGMLLSAAPRAWAQAEQPDDKAATDPMRIALLTYARGKTTACFAASFLAEADQRIKRNIAHEVTRVDLADSKLYDYPFAILAGEDMFTLTSDQRRNLRHFIERGGFLLASPNCASKPWQKSFQRELKQALPEAGLKKLEQDHPIFHIINDVETLTTLSGEANPPIYAIEYQGRVAGVFSPNGLNETDDAGEACECCCGHEIADAGPLKINLLAYALTH